MYRHLLSFGLVAFGLPAFAQTYPAQAIPERPAFTPHKADGVDEFGSLTLQDALSLALSNNPDIRAAHYEFQAIEASIKQADALPNPTLDLNVEDQRRETRETTFQVSQPIELGGKRSARVRAARRAADVASEELNSRRAHIRAVVITTFFDLLKAQDRVRLAQEATALAQRGTHATLRKVTAGTVSPVEETKARVTEASVRLDEVQAKSELVSTRKRLAATWNNSEPRFDHAEGRLDALPPLPNLSALTARLPTSPTIKRARSELERRQAHSTLESSRRVPDVTVTVGIKRSQELGRNQTIIGLSVPLPLFDQNRGGILEAARRTDKAQEELAATQTQLDIDLAQAYEQLKNALYETQALQREILPGAQSAYDAVVKGFEFGKFAFLDVLDAQRILLQTKTQYLNTLAVTHRAAAEIDRLVGELSTDFSN